MTKPSTPPAAPHLPHEDFPPIAAEAIRLITTYLRDIESRPVLGPVHPGDLLNDLPRHPPSTGAADTPSRDLWSALYADLENLILPRMTHWQHPAFFGFFPANASYPAILGEILAAGLATPAFLWVTNPAATELEIRTVDWLAHALDLPPEWSISSGVGGGVIHTTASEATLTALVTARHRARARAMARPGWNPASWHPTLYTSSQAHSSVIKAAMVAGLAHDPDDRTHIRLIEVNDALALDPVALTSAITADLEAARTPIFIAATVGTTSSGAIDPLPEIARIARVHAPDAWVHIDASHHGVAAICPEFRPILTGLEECDSLCVNPHKWLLTNFDCDVFYVRDRRPLINAMSITPAYLRNAASDSGQVIDYRDWQIPLGRRFRALKLWCVFRHYGVEGLRCHIRTGVHLAQIIEQRIHDDPDFELVAPRSLNLVCFRLAPRPGESSPSADARNKRLAEAANASGKLYITPTILPGPPRFVLRIAIGGPATEERHIHDAWQTIRDLAHHAEG
ncbi:MAG: aspartate aminotransferase family protein [Phycisphaeraceae bacterium]|nr:aspartate aminotransferase family protein [Phycisphaeraceae bacterium]